jgi:predicted RNA binding protein YcfA (HicA-like mRNA interferase family)
MAKPPTDLSGHDLRKALERTGFVCTRQRGSYMVMRRDKPPARIVVPAHKRIRPGTLRQILKDAGLTIEQLKALL